MKKLVSLVFAGTLLGAIPSPLAQEQWYRNYEFGLRAIERSEWDEAIRLLEETIAQRDEPNRRARTYRTRFIRYFPYYHLGVVYYAMGDMERARNYFGRSRDFGDVLETDDYGPRLGTLMEAAEGPRGPVEAVRGAEEAQRRELERRVTEGIDHFDAGRFTDAVAAFTAVLAVDPTHAEAEDYLNRTKRQALQQELAQVSARAPELARAIVQVSVFAELEVLTPERPVEAEPAPVAEEIVEPAPAQTEVSLASSMETVAWTIFRDGQALSAEGSLEDAAAKFTAVVTMMEAVGAGSSLQEQAEAHLDAVQFEMQRLAQASREDEIARLRAQLEALTRSEPEIALISPAIFDEAFEDPVVKVQGVVLDDQGIVDVVVEVNGQVWGAPRFGLGGTRNIQVGRRTDAASTLGTQVNFQQDISLDDGDNEIVIRARNVAGVTVEQRFTLRREARERNVFAAVIGISQYAHESIPDLEYAAADAEAFRDYLHQDMGVPEDNVFTLLDGDATRQRMLEVLGEDLRERAEAEDIVIIYYAGHGAPEQDSGDPDGDGAEKYLIPADANPARLFSTGFAMNQVSQIFGRLRAQTILFIADACYSGAAGGDGRTFGTGGSGRAISDNYLNRLGGTGRLILTASSGNQLSHERSDLGHGVFTYHLIQGLQGPADADGDGAITVLEAYQYVSDHVAEDTQNRQNPVLKGDLGGRFLLRSLPSN